MAKIGIFLSYYRPWAVSALAFAVYRQVLCDQNYTIRNAPLYMTKSLLGFLSIWALYTVFVYPRLFSPLRRLPQPKVRLIQEGYWGYH
jgi:hypothetical protein